MQRRSVSPARRLGWLSLAIAFCLLVESPGCPGDHSNRYTIRITPAGDSLDREIRIARFMSPQDSLLGLSDPVLTPGLQDRVSSAYQAKVDTATHRAYSARRRFATVPDDVGNKGSWRVEHTPLGTAWTYDERLRGMDDPGDYLRDQSELSDSLAAIVAGWLRFELVMQPEYPRVAEHLERELRRDAHMMLSEYFVERTLSDTLSDAWLSSLGEEHPLLGLYVLTIEGFTSSDFMEAIPALARARAELARRMGLQNTSDRDRVVGFLSDAGRASESFKRYLAATSVDGSDELDSDALAALYGRNDMSDLLEDEVTVELALREPPEKSNGSWDSTASVVRWFAPAASVDMSRLFAPMTCMAVWAVPDTASQRRLFGRVALTGDALIEYVSLYNAIEPERRAEWDRMLFGLSPGRIEPLKAFRPHDAAGTAGDWAKPLRSHLVNVLAPPHDNAPARPHGASPPAKPGAGPNK